MFSVDNPLDYLDKIDNVLEINLKYFLVAEILNNFVYYLLRSDSCQ